MSSGMKLGEALSERARLQKKIGELRQRINDNAATQEGVDPAENPLVLLDEITQTYDELETLIARINLTNATTELDGESLTVLLARRDKFAGLVATYNGAAHSGQEGAQLGRYMRSELKQTRHVDVAGLRRAADRASADLRALDNQIQSLNWTADLVS